MNCKVLLKYGKNFQWSPLSFPYLNYNLTCWIFWLETNVLQLFLTSSKNWNGTWCITPKIKNLISIKPLKTWLMFFLPLLSTSKCPRRWDAPTTVTASPFLNCSLIRLFCISSGKFIFMRRICGYASFELPVTVYDLDGGTGGGVCESNNKDY